MTSVESKKIGTHNGTFHCDEALACFLLRLTAQYAGAEVVRSRDPAVLDALPIIVDVGGVFDPAKGRFDHHQRGFEETFSPKHKIKLSSAGLIYKYFGKEIIQKLTGASEKSVDVLYLEMYRNFIEALDGIDNGVNQYPAELQPAYINNTDLSSRVGALNPAWNEDGVDMQARFLRAMEMAGTEFVDRLKYLANSWLPARDVVLQAIEKRHEIHPSGEIILLPRYTQWQGHLFDLEKELHLEPSIKYCLYQDSNGSWRVQAVAERSGSFNSRKALPEPWRGIRDDALSALTGIPGCIFVHASGFIGGNATREGVLAMTIASLGWAPTVEPDQKKQKV